MKISATLITLNEQDSIERAIRSVEWADEILVVDSGSTDRTTEIAERLGARVLHREWSGFADQKQFAADQASNDWIFSLDADEEVTPELCDEILRIKEKGTDDHGFKIPRLAYYMGRPIRHSGWYPDRQLRLYDRTKGRWNQMPVHESVQIEDRKKIALLSGEILHFSVKSAAQHHQMIGERYAPLAAEAMYENGRTTSILKVLFAAPSAFIRSYLLKLGFLDGLPGLVIANFAAHHAFLKQVLLYEKIRQTGKVGSLRDDNQTEG